MAVIISHFKLTVLEAILMLWWSSIDPFIVWGIQLSFSSKCYLDISPDDLKIDKDHLINMNNHCYLPIWMTLN